MLIVDFPLKFAKTCILKWSFSKGFGDNLHLVDYCFHSRKGQQIFDEELNAMRITRNEENVSEVG